MTGGWLAIAHYSEVRFQYAETGSLPLTSKNGSRSFTSKLYNQFAGAHCPAFSHVQKLVRRRSLVGKVRYRSRGNYITSSLPLTGYRSRGNYINSSLPLTVQRFPTLTEFRTQFPIRRENKIPTLLVDTEEDVRVFSISGGEFWEVSGVDQFFSFSVEGTLSGFSFKFAEEVCQV